MNLLITGGCGFLGSNLAAYGIRNGARITIFDNLSRLGSADNLQWLRSIGEFNFVHGDIRNKSDVDRVVCSDRFDVIFHVAGQVAMTTSISNPYADFQVNAQGTVNLLDSVRQFSTDTGIIYSSTNKVYGDLEQYSYIEKETRYICEEYQLGFDEKVPLEFHSPYGCSKGCADQYMLDFHRIYGLKTVVFRHSSMYGGRQFATFDQGWIGWFIKKALEIKSNPGTEPFTISGNGKQVRDILHADDMVNLYYTVAGEMDKVSGQVFNIGGTMEQSLSLLELFEILERRFDIEMRYVKLPPRISDQKVFVADITRIQKAVGWKPRVHIGEGIDRMIEWTDHI